MQLQFWSCAAHAAASHVLHMHDAIASLCAITTVCVCDHAMQFTVVHIKAKAKAKVGRVSQGGLL